jgi:hypothetical protein
VIQPIPPIPPIPPVPFPETQPPPEIFIRDGPPESILFAAMVIVGIIVTGIVLLPVIRALARRLEGRALDPAVMTELEQLRGRMTELEQVHGRIAELEERLDFSERLLTQNRDRPVLRGGLDAPG